MNQYCRQAKVLSIKPWVCMSKYQIHLRRTGRCGTRGKAYPTTVGCATAFALVCILQIQFDLSKYNFPLSCLLWALALGAFAGMTAVAAAQTYYESKNAPLASNLIALGVAIAAFAALYIAGGSAGEVSERAAMRVLAAIFVSLVAFVMIAGRRSDETDFVRGCCWRWSYFIALLQRFALAGASGCRRGGELSADRPARSAAISDTIRSFGISAVVSYFA